MRIIIVSLLHEVRFAYKGSPCLSFLEIKCEKYMMYMFLLVFVPFFHPCNTPVPDRHLMKPHKPMRSEVLKGKEEKKNV